jgi:hypothetical protein
MGAHFIPVAMTYRVGQYAEVYISHIICYHSIPKTIISNRGSIFVAHFLEQLHKVFGHPSHQKLNLSPPDRRTEGASQSNHRRYAPCLCFDGWPEIGQAPATSWILVQQQLSKEYQDVTLWGTLRMTLSHPTELVWVWRKGYLWSGYCDRGRREGEANLSKHPSRPISSEKLHQQAAQSLGIWSGWSRIPSSFPNEKCMPFWYQRKASSLLNWFVSYH